MSVPRLDDLATRAGLLGIGVLEVLAQRITGYADVPLAPSEADHALFARLQKRMSQRGLWRDLDVTLSMLARRLHVPAKILSVAVNRVTGKAPRAL